jgi:hypothetical protein
MEWGTGIKTGETGLLPAEARHKADREAADEVVFHAGLLLRRLNLRLGMSVCPIAGVSKIYSMLMTRQTQ